jgi:hypothetical protein
MLGLLLVLISVSSADGNVEILRREFQSASLPVLETFTRYSLYRCSDSPEAIRRDVPSLEWELRFEVSPSSETDGSGYFTLTAFGDRVAFQIFRAKAGEPIRRYGLGGLGLLPQDRIFVRQNSFRDLVIEIAASPPIPLEVIRRSLFREFFGESEPTPEPAPPAISSEGLVGTTYWYCDHVETP